MKNKILFLGPGEGNGGIASWSRKYVANYKSDKYELCHVYLKGGRRNPTNLNMFSRITDGLLDLRDKYKMVKKIIAYNDFKIMHATTSGSLGTLKDYVIGKYCQKHNIKIIMHCRYGCIPEDFRKKNLMGWLLRKTMRMYDQVWVLDKRSENALKKDGIMRDKVFLTPNCIEVPKSCDLSPKTYRHIGFIGNLMPTKGLLELIKAVRQIEEVKLSIVGPGTEDQLKTVKDVAGDNLNHNIFVLGQLPNDQAVNFMESIDILALPTYYQWEGFPISIIEAMSKGKLVISTNRAAIPDMLTALDGGLCGIIVKEKSIDDIVEAISWCLSNSREADEMCAKAYEKVYTSYRTEVVYDLYTRLYDRVLV